METTIVYWGYMLGLIIYDPIAYLYRASRATILVAM